VYKNINNEHIRCTFIENFALQCFTLLHSRLVVIIFIVHCFNFLCCSS